MIDVKTKMYKNLLTEKEWVTISKPELEKATDAEDSKFLALSAHVKEMRKTFQKSGGLNSKTNNDGYTIN